MAERKDNGYSFQEGLKGVLLAPLSYATKLRHGVHLQDKVVLAELVVIEGLLLSLARGEINPKNLVSIALVNACLYVVAGILLPKR